MAFGDRGRAGLLTVKRNERTRTSLAISAAGHAGLLLLALVSFGGKSFDAPSTESFNSEPFDEPLPIDIISIDQFTQLTKGQINAAKVETVKPLAEKIADADPAETVATVSDNLPDELPPPEEADATPVETVATVSELPPQEKVDATPADSKKEPKPDAIAEALKRDEAKEPPKPEPKPKPVQPQPKSDPKQIAAPLNSDTRRKVASADALSLTSSLGTTTGRAAVLSLTERDALRGRISQCWSPPAGAANAQDVSVRIRVAFKPDGSVAGSPEFVGGTISPYGPAVGASAVRAILRCQPYKMLRPETYHVWKDFIMTFKWEDFER
jgi:outer membrane biosynthesis protein TonB